MQFFLYNVNIVQDKNIDSLIWSSATHNY